jgi:hypothetical protein
MLVVFWFAPIMKVLSVSFSAFSVNLQNASAVLMTVLRANIRLLKAHPVFYQMPRFLGENRIVTIF